MIQKPRWHSYITLNIYWLGLMTISQTNGLVLPLLVQRFVGPDQQGTAYGNLRLYTLMIALLSQALMGILSDHSSLRWGRRRPFIMVGTLLAILCMIAVAASSSYWTLFTAALCVQIAVNIAQAAQQGLIPDLVPVDYRARVSAVKSIMELLPVIIVAFTIAKLIAAGNMWGGILVANGILFTSLTITMLVRESPPSGESHRLDWKPFGRLFIMTLTFTLIILVMGKIVKEVGQFFNAVESPILLFALMGATGTIAMAIAIIAGIWLCIRISIGAQNVHKTPSFIWWVINRLAFLVGVTNLSTFAVYFLQARLGLEGEAAAEPASRLMSVVGLMILLSAIPSGWIADRIGKKPLVLASGIAATLGTVILLLSPTMGVIYVGGCIVGMATGIFYTTTWALGTDIVPRDMAGRYLGIANLAGAGAGAIGAHIGGPIADFFSASASTSKATGYLLIFGIYAVLFLLSIFAASKIREHG